MTDTIYRATVIEEEEDTPILIQAGLLSKDNIDFSVDNFNMIPCLNRGFNISEEYLIEIIPLLDFINNNFISINLNRSFTPIERTVDRVDDLQIKQASIRGISDVLRYDKIG